MKTCTRCQQDKPIEAFRHGQGYKGGYHSECKACEADRLRRWRQNNPDKLRDQWVRNKDAQKRRGTGITYDPDRTAERKMLSRNSHLKRTYGITLDELIKMYESQGGKCAACGQPIFLTHTKHGPTVSRAVVDHCHTTGRVRAVLCDRCNRMIGHAGEDASYLRKLAEYLESAE